MLKVAPCPVCVDGRVIDEGTGVVSICEVCHGLSKVTPLNICNCGRSCCKVKNQTPYCGNEACLTAIEQAIKYLSYTAPQQRPIPFGAGVTQRWSGWHDDFHQEN